MGDTKQFHEAIRNADLTRIDQCIQEGILIDQFYHYRYQSNCTRDYWTEYFTPLICAVENQRIKVVELLLKRGATVLIKSKEGETPLSVAARVGNFEIVKLLVENGAKPSMQTALLVAIQYKRLNIVRYLVKNGAHVNWKYKNGNTPVSKSITTDTPLTPGTTEGEDITKFLFDNGANLEEPGIDGYTPLGLSVRYQRLGLLKYLLQKGANIDKIDNQGRTALSVAASNKYFHFAIYLVEAGANIRLAQKDVDEYAETDDDFDIYLKLFKREQFKLNNPDKKEASVSLLEKQSGSGQEEASPNLASTI